MGIGGSMTHLFWLMMLLLAVMYMFAVALTQGACAWMNPGPEEDPPQHALLDDVDSYFGSILSSIYTLFMSMTGGINWGEPAAAARAFGKSYFCIFTFFAFFAI